MGHIGGVEGSEYIFHDFMGLRFLPFDFDSESFGPILLEFYFGPT